MNNNLTDFNSDGRLLTSSKVRHIEPEDLGFDFNDEVVSVEAEDVDDIVEQTGYDDEEVERWFRSIKRKKQAIFYGPPGTGKTFTAKRIAEVLTDGTEDNIETLQLHSAYSYEDFIQGIRPVSNSNDDLRYPVIQGRFLDFCEKSRATDDPCVMILDEINRADLSSVFGELMHLLEYRDESMKLAQKDVENTDDEEFSIPENVILLGTMNTADRSIALVDFALRRRFAFLPLWPDFNVLRNFHNDTGFDVDGLIEVLKEINDTIGDRNFHLGFTYFLEEDLNQHIEDIWKLEIEPYLDEYFFDSPQKVEQYRWDAVRDRVMP